MSLKGGVLQVSQDRTQKFAKFSAMSEGWTMVV